MFSTSRIYFALKFIDNSDPENSTLTLSVPIDLSFPNELTTHVFLKHQILLSEISHLI